MMDSVVLISTDDFIQGSVTFTENVVVLDTVELENDLDTKILCGCNVDDWIKKAVYIGDGHYDGKFLLTHIDIFSYFLIQVESIAL